MASTLTPQKAYENAKSYVKNMPLDRVSARLADDINKMMWMAAPWRWTLGSMSAVTLLANTQDYTVTVPADFLYLQSAYLSDGTTSPRELKIDPVLPTAVTLTGQVARVALTGTTLGVSPRPGTQPSTAPQIISLYKKIAPVITASNMAAPGALIFDDEWFWVYQEGFLWKAYQWADDSRAGGVTVNEKGQIQYTGQRAIFEAGLAMMKISEKLADFEARG